MVYSWTKETGLANLNRSCLIGELFSGSEQPGGESYGRCFLHTPSKFPFRPGRRLVGWGGTAIFPWVRGQGP